jgi:malonate decarboxylase beta subunit
MNASPVLIEHIDDLSSRLSARLSASWYESSARQRVAALLDVNSFKEFIPPQDREMSPHLSIFDLPKQFDDGMIVGHGRLAGTPVLVAAQEGRFMGGAFGEVHGAKLTGLLRAAREIQSMPVLILFDTGGVRLQEANAGELAIAEIMRALVHARIAGVPVIGLLGGRSGCYGGGGLIAGCCSALAISEQGRLGVSGPEVIETNRGVEEFDARDRALVWRTMGGKHRKLLGAVNLFVRDSMLSFREAAAHLMRRTHALDGEVLQAEQKRLEHRIERFGECTDSREVWQAMGVASPETVPDISDEDFINLASRYEEIRRDAR